MAVHLQRLLPYLHEAGISVQMYSVGRRTDDHPDVRQVSDRPVRWFLGLLFGPCEPVHYVFSDNTLARFAAALLAVFRDVKVVLRVGGASLASAVASRNYLEQWLIRFAIRHVTVVIGVNPSICNLAQRLGAEQVLHIPGFIPPLVGQSPPPEVAAFLKAGSGPVLLASGEVRKTVDEDIYGAYVLLELLDRNPGVRLVYYAYQITLNEDGQHQLRREIEKRGLRDRYLLFASKTELAPAMLYCDVLLRPTLSDGDSNSLREALYLGIPVIASDCVERPQGVHVYRTGDTQALCEALENVLGNLAGQRAALHAQPKYNYATPIVTLFQQLLGRRPSRAN